MLDYTEYIKMIANYGALVIIAAAFIWDKLHTDKMILELLARLEKSLVIQQEIVTNIVHHNEETRRIITDMDNSAKTLNTVVCKVEQKTGEIDKHLGEFIAIQCSKGRA